MKWSDATFDWSAEALTMLPAEDVTRVIIHQMNARISAARHSGTFADEYLGVYTAEEIPLQLRMRPTGVHEEIDDQIDKIIPFYVNQYRLREVTVQAQRRPLGSRLPKWTEADLLEQIGASARLRAETVGVNSRERIAQIKLMLDQLTVTEQDYVNGQYYKVAGPKTTDNAAITAAWLAAEWLTAQDSFIDPWGWQEYEFFEIQSLYFGIDGNELRTPSNPRIALSIPSGKGLVATRIDNWLTLAASTLPGIGKLVSTNTTKVASREGRWTETTYFPCVPFADWISSIRRVQDWTSYLNSSSGFHGAVGFSGCAVWWDFSVVQ